MSSLFTRITGMGSVTPFGKGVSTLWHALEEEASCLDKGVAKIMLEGATYSSQSLSLCMLAIEEAMEQAGWKELGPDDGLILATTTGLIELWETDLMRFEKGELKSEAFLATFCHEPLGELLRSVGQILKFNGKSCVITTACSASTQAIGLAHEWLQSGEVKRCLVGGVEVLSRLTIEGFKGLKLISEKRCRPFQAEREGINLSEAAAFLCLERRERPALAKILGHGQACDAYHMTAPHPEGLGCYRAIQAALKQAELKAYDIQAVHAHGTGSLHNDWAESSAIHQVLQGHAAQVYSTKPCHGHALAATGALETILSVRALQEQKYLKTPGLETVDEKIKINCLLTNEQTSRPLKNILKTTLGFGGINAALLLSAE